MSDKKKPIKRQKLVEFLGFITAICLSYAQELDIEEEMFAFVESLKKEGEDNE